MAYRIYLTDTLQILGQGKARKDRFADRIMPSKPVESKPTEETVNDILAKAGIEVKHGISI